MTCRICLSCLLIQLVLLPGQGQTNYEVHTPADQSILLHFLNLIKCVFGRGGGGDAFDATEIALVMQLEESRW